MAAISGMTLVSVLQTDTGDTVNVSEYYLRSGDVLWPDLSCDVDPERLAGWWLVYTSVLVQYSR